MSRFGLGFVGGGRPVVFENVAGDVTAGVFADVIFGYSLRLVPNFGSITISPPGIVIIDELYVTTHTGELYLQLAGDVIDLLTGKTLNFAGYNLPLSSASNSGFDGQRTYFYFSIPPTSLTVGAAYPYSIVS